MSPWALCLGPLALLAVDPAPRTAAADLDAYLSGYGQEFQRRYRESQLAEWETNPGRALGGGSAAGSGGCKEYYGGSDRFRAVPFFWSQHYDVPINYVGHAERWNAIQIDGDLSAKDCAVRFLQGGRALAIATIYRDRESLKAELVMEQALGG